MADYDRDEDMAVDETAKEPQRLRSMVSTDKKQKGRGFSDTADARDRYGSANFESLGQASKTSGPAKSVEGWVVFVTGVHEEAQEEDIQEAFSEHGNIKNIYLNLDRQTGFVKGYALVEYANKNEAAAAIDQLDGKDLLTQQIHVSWAFFSAPAKRAGGRNRR